LASFGRVGVGDTLLVECAALRWPIPLDTGGFRIALNSLLPLVIFDLVVVMIGPPTMR
jgi:hypothetical protein